MYAQVNRDEYSTREELVTKSFYDRYGYDERDGPPEEEEESGYVDDPEGPLDRLNYRR